MTEGARPLWGVAASTEGVREFLEDHLDILVQSSETCDHDWRLGPIQDLSGWTNDVCIKCWLIWPMDHRLGNLDKVPYPAYDSNVDYNGETERSMHGVFRESSA